VIKARLAGLSPLEAACNTLPNWGEKELSGLYSYSTAELFRRRAWVSDVVDQAVERSVVRVNHTLAQRRLPFPRDVTQAWRKVLSPASKLHPKWVGPYRIVHLDDASNRVVMRIGDQDVSVHMEQCRPAYGEELELDLLPADAGDLPRTDVDGRQPLPLAAAPVVPVLPMTPCVPLPGSRLCSRNLGRARTISPKCHWCKGCHLLSPYHCLQESDHRSGEASADFVDDGECLVSDPDSDGVSTSGGDNAWFVRDADDGVASCALCDESFCSDAVAFSHFRSQPHMNEVESMEDYMDTVNQAMASDDESVGTSEGPSHELVRYGDDPLALEARDLVGENRDLFSETLRGRPPMKCAPISFEVKDGPPVRIKQYPFDERRTAVVDVAVANWEQDDVIGEHGGLQPHDYCLSLVCADQLFKHCGESKVKTRVCLDLRPVNTRVCSSKMVSTTEPYESHIRRLGSSEGLYFGVDVTQGFLQIEVDPACWRYLIFRWNGRYYHFKRLPFGLLIAPIYFQLVMDNTLAVDAGVPSYVDDLVWRERCLATLRRLFASARRHCITLKGSKAEFCVDSIGFFGQQFSQAGVSMATGRAEDLRQLLPLQRVQHIQRFLGTLLFVDQYLPSVHVPPVDGPSAEMVDGYRRCTRRLQKLLDKDPRSGKRSRMLSDVQQGLANEWAEFILKYCVHQICLRFPIPGVECVLYTDASVEGSGGACCQRQEGRLVILGYFIKGFGKHALNWPMSTKELAALAYGLSRFAPLIQLSAVPPVAFVDNSGLYGILSHDEVAMAEVRKRKAHVWVWIRLLMLVRFWSCRVEWLRGTANCLADALSRALELQEVRPLVPHPDCRCSDCTGDCPFHLPFDLLGC
jgi:hypothetical protein